MRGHSFLLAFFVLLWVAPPRLCAQDKQPLLPVSPLGKNNPAYEAPPFPHREIERVDHPVVIAWHAGARKHFIAPELFPASFNSQQFGTAALALRMAAASPGKDYLFHIYPSHNFW